MRLRRGGDPEATSIHALAAYFGLLLREAVSEMEAARSPAAQRQIADRLLVAAGHVVELIPSTEPQFRRAAYKSIADFAAAFDLDPPWKETV